MKYMSQTNYTHPMWLQVQGDTLYISPEETKQSFPLTKHKTSMREVKRYNKNCQKYLQKQKLKLC